MKNVLALIVGFFVGSAWNMAFVSLNTSIFGAPDGETIEAMREHTANLPAKAFLLVMVAHVGHAALGGWIGARMSSTRPKVIAWIIGGFVALSAAVFFVALKSPLWNWIDVVLILMAAWFVGNLETKRREGLAS